MCLDIILRVANLNDLTAIEALVEAAYGPYRKAIGVEPGPLQDDYTDAITKNRVQVLIRGPDIISLLILIPKSDALLIDNVAIDPAWQGQGLGRYLMSVAEAVGRAGCHPCLRLYTHEKMAANIALYGHLGFEETARIRERGLNRVYIEKPLI